MAHLGPFYRAIDGKRSKAYIQGIILIGLENAGFSLKNTLNTPLTPSIVVIIPSILISAPLWDDDSSQTSANVWRQSIAGWGLTNVAEKLFEQKFKSIFVGYRFERDPFSAHPCARRDHFDLLLQCLSPNDHPPRRGKGHDLPIRQ